MISSDCGKMTGIMTIIRWSLSYSQEQLPELNNSTSLDQAITACSIPTTCVYLLPLQ